MKIYTEDEYLEDHKQINHYLCEMVVFQDDLAIIDSYSLEQLHSCLDNANESLKRLNEGTVTDILSFQESQYKAEKIDLYRKPFTLFSQMTFSGMNYRMSLCPYTEENHHLYDLIGEATAKDSTQCFMVNGKERYRGDIGKYVKAGIEDENKVRETLQFFIAYMNSRVLNHELTAKPPKQNPTKRTFKI